MSVETTRFVSGGDTRLGVACGSVQAVSIDQVLDDFAALIRGRSTGLKTERTAEGLRVAVATGLLFRGLELLDATRVSPGVAGELLMRAGVEVTLRGRFVLMCGDGPDEFARMLSDHRNRGETLVRTLKLEDPDTFFDTHFAGVAPWVFEVVKPSSAKLRDLYSLAAAIDGVTGLEPKDRRSATFAYRRYYQWLSNSAMHGGIGSIGRFIENAGAGVVDDQPDPLSAGRRWDILLALQLLELARVVWIAHRLPTDELEATGVQWK